MPMAAFQTPSAITSRPPVGLPSNLESNRRQLHKSECPNHLETDYCNCPWRVDNPSDPHNQTTDHFPHCRNAAGQDLCFCPLRTRPVTPPLVIPGGPGYSSPSGSSTVMTPPPAWKPA
ncbi:uncharacterized protein CLUP02_15073 [Colletotrichum lupini]|uniref:Uncharacterized protein n=1 Tax=Colletotrichum lupini TaxID=145971 RepID=A0A9Q8WNN3_9PEZI|nr:uncharacterized protein CLUP02_15073 [Colletotrichum lupini]UQC89542.1 hypothetical protein CLUP02_15073 [Colletotrichum lupini]